MQVEISAIPPDQIIHIWNRVAPLLERLIREQGYGSLEEVFERHAIKQYDLLWVAWEKNNLDNILMVISTRIVEGNKEKGETNILELLGVVGEQRYLWDTNLSFKLQQFAKDNECNRIKIKNGRKGWKKFLAKQGMKITGYTFEKKI
tara:strand:- start:196 stop:636 length:441 start_codon:yes stop_codon:yes gene_type:complete